MAWKDGFKVGFESGRIEIPSMSAQLSQYQKSIDQEKMLKAQQKKAEMDRIYAVADKSDIETSVIFKENFDDTGIADYDVLGSKMLESYRNFTLRNTFLFKNGQLDEDQYKANQRGALAGFSKFKDIYQNINKKAEGQVALQNQGKDNIVNTFRSEMLADFAGNIRFGVDPKTNLPIMSTIDKNGKEIIAPTSFIQSLVTNDSGADIDSAVEELVKEKGFSEALSKDQYKKYIDYSGNTEMLRSLVSKKAGSFNEAQVIDAAFKLGILSDDEEFAKDNKDVEYMNYQSWGTLDREKITELRGKVIDGMSKYTEEMLDFKFGSRVNKPEKEETKLIQTPVTVEPTFEREGIIQTFFAAQAKDNINNLQDPSLDPDDIKEFKKKNSDLYDDKGLIPAENLDIKAVNVPIPFSAKEIMNIGISSSSDKQWDNIDGFVLVKSKKTTIENDGSETYSYGPYNIRLRGSVISDKGQMQEKAQTPKVGESTMVEAKVQEQRFERADDISSPIADKELTRVWNVYLGKNQQIAKAYETILQRARQENLNLSDPAVSRQLIGQTIEQFFTK